MAARQRPYLERLRRRYGPVFTIRILGFGDLVVLAEPDLIKKVFQADPKVLHAGDRSPLRKVLGRNSLLGIDEGDHLSQRRLLLPPFKGERVRAYSSVIEDIAVAEVDRFPEGLEFPVAPAMQRITLRAILVAVFGASGHELDELEELMPPFTEQGSRLSRFPALHRDAGRWSPWGRFLRLRAEIDAVLDRLIAIAKADPGIEDRADVLAALVRARHADGSPMENEEIRDQLITMLAAGHETTSHQLSWAVERLTRNPAALDQLVAEVDDSGSEYRLATIREVQRMRPVIFFAGRHATEPYEIDGHVIPINARIGLAAALTHFDPSLFDEPDRFNPQRFLDAPPGTYSWIPFGGGVRRCIGATFAHLEMDIVLRVILERFTLLPTSDPPEGWASRGVAMAPARGGRVTVERRHPS